MEAKSFFMGFICGCIVFSGFVILYELESLWNKRKLNRFQKTLMSKRLQEQIFDIPTSIRRAENIPTHVVQMTRADKKRILRLFGHDKLANLLPS